MSDFDRYANSRSGAGIARSDVDQGLRAYMIGVYNYMTLGLGVTGLVAYAAFALGTVQMGDGRLGLTELGHAIYVSPLRWIIVLSPLALVFYISARINSMSVAERPHRLHRLRGADRPLHVGPAGRLYGRLDRARVLRHRRRLREPQPLWLHDPARPLGDGFVHDDGGRRPRSSRACSTCSCTAPACSSGSQFLRW